MGYGLMTARNTVEAGEIRDSYRFIDLKLGGFRQLEVQPFDKLDYRLVPRMELPSSSKRARALNIGTQVASCLVDGCNSDLSKCRDYHRRHKVCELHSKTPTVTIRGQEQRFCQQCSRFHSLVEFDDDKRSCRKRLDGHNRRRRKPQPDPLSLTAGRFLSTLTGARSTPSGSSSMFTMSSLGDCPWPGSVKAENGSVHYSSHHQLLSFSNRNVSSFPGSALHDLRTHTQFSPAVGVGNAGLMPSQSSSVSSRQTPSTDVNRVVASGRALSLLSSLSAETPEKGLSHMMQPAPSTSTQSWIGSGLQYQRTAAEKPLSAMLGLECTNDGIFPCQGLFQAEHGVISSSAPSATTSFLWE